MWYSSIPNDETNWQQLLRIVDNDEPAKNRKPRPEPVPMVQPPDASVLIMRPGDLVEAQRSDEKKNDHPTLERHRWFPRHVRLVVRHR